MIDRIKIKGKEYHNIAGKDGVKNYTNRKLAVASLLKFLTILSHHTGF